jgi:hypothetical protein
MNLSMSGKCVAGDDDPGAKSGSLVLGVRSSHSMAALARAVVAIRRTSPQLEPCVVRQECDHSFLSAESEPVDLGSRHNSCPRSRLRKLLVETYFIPGRFRLDHELLFE